MKKNILLLILLCILTPMGLNATGHETFMDSVSRLDHHHTPWDILTGSGDDTIVCYKQAHRNIYFLVTGLIVLIAIIALKLLRLNKRTTKLLRKQNSLIEEKNKNITDSIHYAKRLQNAILPTEQTIRESLKEHFILYQPKDIVSGDFYWVSHLNGKSIVAAIDCTGHGVPGALLSIVGHNAINQSINEHGLTSPAKIMDHMNTTIKSVLQQDKGNDIKDGMDMALCCIDYSSKTIEFAGANNPLYLIRGGKLEIIKGSKLTVGSISETVNVGPENHQIQLAEGDVLYLFSDGYADQFGGSENKKFKSSRMQQTLLDIYKLSMNDQKTALMKAFEEWKGNNEQVDDVLVIGIRL